MGTSNNPQLAFLWNLTEPQHHEIVGFYFPRRKWEFCAYVPVRKASEFRLWMNAFEEMKAMEPSLALNCFAGAGPTSDPVARVAKGSARL